MTTGSFDFDDEAMKGIVKRACELANQLSDVDMEMWLHMNWRPASLFVHCVMLATQEEQDRGKKI